MRGPQLRFAARRAAAARGMTRGVRRTACNMPRCKRTCDSERNAARLPPASSHTFSACGHKPTYDPDMRRKHAGTACGRTAFLVLSVLGSGRIAKYASSINVHL